MAILTHNHLFRGKRAIEGESNGKQIAQILPDGSICFAGHKILKKNEVNDDETLREALNTFILLLSHRRGKSSGYFQPL